MKLGYERITTAKAIKTPTIVDLAWITGITNTKYLKANTKKKILHSWRVAGSRARGVMLTFYPLLCSRRQEQIRRALLGNPGRRIVS